LIGLEILNWRGVVGKKRSQVRQEGTPVKFGASLLKEKRIENSCTIRVGGINQFRREETRYP